MLTVTLKHTQPEDAAEAQNFAAGTTDPSEVVWVVFENESGNTWAAKFKRGLTTTESRAAVLADGTVFVLAAGQGYFVDPERKTLLSKTHDDYYQSFIVVPASALVAATDGCQIDLLNRNGTAWSSPRIAADEIHFISATENEVKGRYNVIPPTMFHEFTLHVKERTLEYPGPWKG